MDYLREHRKTGGAESQKNTGFADTQKREINTARCGGQVLLLLSPAAHGPESA
jgi:hypothetical protein